MKEEWLAIKGYEGKYEASNMGRIKSVERKVNVKGCHERKVKEIILSPRLHDDGYLKVRLYSKGKSKQYYIHRLVALAFIKNPFNKKQVNHKNLNKKDNKKDNLEWATPKENVGHYWTLKNEERKAV